MTTVYSQWLLTVPDPPLFSRGTAYKLGHPKYSRANYSTLGVFIPNLISPFIVISPVEFFSEVFLLNPYSSIKF